MSANTFSRLIHINNDLRSDFKKICDGIGIAESKIVTVFIKKTLQKKEFVFDLLEFENICKLKDDGRFSLRIDRDTYAEFKSFCEEYGMSFNSVIKLFFYDVIKEGNLKKYLDM